MNRPRLGTVVSGCLSLTAALAPAPAWATYSIAATDSRTSQVGGVIASCVQVLSTTSAYASSPGRGVVFAQAAVNFAARNQAADMLTQGTAPADIIAAITAPSFDDIYQDRQYGIVDLQGRAAAFTGTETDREALHRTGTFETFTYSVQGNILTSENVVPQVQAGFVAGGCDLAERLMLALRAGARAGGDSRCAGQGTSANSASLRVDLPDGTRYADLEVTNTGTQDAAAALQVRFDAWRATHACGTGVSDAGADAGADAGPGGADSGTDAGSVGDAGTQPPRTGCACATTVGAGPTGSAPDLRVVSLAMGAAVASAAARRSRRNTRDRRPG